MNPRHLLFLFLLVFGAACQGTTQSSKSIPTQPRSNISPGKVAEEVKVYADTSLSYAVYLPKNYTHAKPHGVVYMFDPQGDGVGPVKHYSILADMYELVVIGSWDSKNGSWATESTRIFQNLLQDTREKFNIDSNRIYLAGFSGGARVAASLAQEFPQVRAVAGCAAGFTPSPSDKFSYIGIVGMEDFNYQEMRALDETLDRTQIHHMFEYFTGGHKWPPVNFMAKAFQFFQMRSMAAGVLEKTDKAIGGMLRNYRYQDSLMAAKKEDQYRWVLQRKTIGYLKGLEDVSAMEELKAKLDSSEQVKQEQKYLDQELVQEMNLRNQYSSLLQTAPVEQWKNTAALLNKMARHGQDKQGWMTKRVLNYLSLNCFMFANQAFASADIANSERYVAIYGMVDPENTEPSYMQAKISMRKNDVVGAFSALEKSFMLGNRDWKRLQNDPDFAVVKQQNNFQELIKRMQTTPPNDPN